jgi:hypothetical protein
VAVVSDRAFLLVMPLSVAAVIIMAPLTIWLYLIERRERQTKPTLSDSKWWA